MSSTATTAEAAAPSPAQGAWAILALLVTIALSDAIASTIAALAMVQIAGTAHATTDEAAWMAIIHISFKLAGFLIAANLLTQRPAWQLIRYGSAAMVLASAGCALFGDLALLLVCRAMQGFAGACLFVAGQALLFQIFERKRQPLIQALFAVATIMAPTTLAPILAGWLLDARDWQWVFVFAILFALPGIGIRASGDSPAAERSGFDWPGSAVLIGATVALMYVLQEGSRFNWFDDSHIGELTILGTILVAAFLWWQASPHNPSPLLDFGAFADEHFAFGCTVSLVAGIALFGSAFLVPAFALRVLGMSSFAAGALLLPSALCVSFGLLAAAMLIQERGAQPFKFIPLGILCVMISMWLLSGSNAASGAADMMPGLLIRGLGLGILFISLTMVTLGDLPSAQLPNGIALFNFGRQLGGQIGIGLLASYLDRQAALNKVILSPNLAPDNPVLGERIEGISALLTARGYNPDDVQAAASAIIQSGVARQVGALGFNEAFLSLALLFVGAAPVLITFKLLLARAHSKAHARHSPD